MSKPKFVVFKLKELLLTAALVILGVAILALVIALVSMKKESTPNLVGPSADQRSIETSAPLYYASLPVYPSSPYTQTILPSSSPSPSLPALPPPVPVRSPLIKMPA